MMSMDQVRGGRVQGGPLARRPAMRWSSPGGTAFAAALEAGAGRDTDAAETDKLAGVAEPLALGSMLALQEMGAGSVRDREARRRGQGLLAALAALQRGLLDGDDDLAALQRLADLAEAAPDAEDKRLGAVLSAIVLRARVELARRGG
jgi:hypothetical protein